MSEYQTYNPKIDRLIEELVAAAGDGANGDLTTEIITTAIKVHQENPNRGDLKMINNVLKEMRWTSRVFGRHPEPKVTIFGSARLKPDSPDYQLAREFSEVMAEHGWGVVTGAGPGIMEASNLGAGAENSYGVAIKLPFEATVNPYLLPERTINFKYFFTRKLGFVKEAHAFALFPGGVGTLDEAFELLTLLQTGKSDMHPVLLLDAPGSGYWQPVTEFMSEIMVNRQLISPHDLNFFHHFSDPEQAASHILRFYSNYQSQRYIEQNLVLRMLHGPNESQLQTLNQNFSEILPRGPIRTTSPHPEEIAENDSIDCDRLVLGFDRRNFGRLRLLIDQINSWVEMTETVHPPPVFTEAQQERPW